MNTLKTRFAGLAALVTVVGIVVGAPWLLLTFHPFTQISWMTLRTTLTHPDDGTVALALIAVIGWITWAYFTVAVILEAIAAIQKRPAFVLPGFHLPQQLARRLVAAVAMLFIAAPMAAGTAHADPVDTSPHQQPAVTASRTPSTPAQPRAPASTGYTVHTVAKTDSLRSLAQEHLGDADRWEEIFKASTGITQPDGQHLTDPDLIVDGWTLHIPTTTAASPAAPSTGYTVHTVAKTDSLRSLAQEHLGDADRWEEIFKASTGITQPDGQHLTDPDLIVDGWTLHIPTTTSKSHTTSGTKTTASRTNPTTTPATAGHTRPASKAGAAVTPGTVAPTTKPTASAKPPAPASATSAGQPTLGDDLMPQQAPAVQQNSQAPSALPTAATATQTDNANEEAAWPIRTATGVGAMAAAGVITLIGARRARQQRRRRRGEAIAMPGEKTMAVENQLRAVADPLAVEDVDCALRQLAAACTANEKPLPTVRAARLTGDQFDLYLAEPAELPEPWYGTPDKTVWSLDASDRPVSPRRLREETPAPYPALVTLGHDLEDGHVFVDLEHLGSLAVVAEGNDATETTRAIAAALTVELATSRWADHLQVTCVGAFADLEGALQTGRIRYVPTMTAVLDELERRTRQDQEHLVAQTGGVGLAQARVTATATDAWIPEVLIASQPLTSSEQERLNDIIETTPQVAISVVTLNEPHLGNWTLRVPATGVDSTVLEPLNLQLRAQQITAHDYQAILDSVSTATYDLPTDVVVTPAPMAAVTTLPLAAMNPPERSPFARPEPDDQESAADETVEPVKPVPAALAGLVKAPSPTQAAPETETTPEQQNTATDQENHPEQPADPAAGSAEDLAVDAAAIPTIAEYAKLRPVREITTADGKPWEHPLIRIMGPVELEGAKGTHPGTKSNVCTEYAAFLALHPDTSVEALDDALWPGRSSANNSTTRNPYTSRLRSWLGVNPATEVEYFPRFTYRLEGVTTDWHLFQELVPGAPSEVSSADLAKALSMVRGRPFDGAAGGRGATRKSGRYRFSWAEMLRQEITAKIVDAAEELALRNLHAGRWGATEEAVALGIRMNPGVERLWRIRILAAHQAHDKKAEDEAIERLYVLVEDELESDLEPETVEFLAALEDRSEPFEKLEALL
ncbi:MAG: hypothetical protein L0G49_02115 [Luteococcus sp.]|uniref:hypothetical protein n=1 Tax=Luteococcus sp. TaxID=1969402 RepID=UPI002647A12D|nr:hypothetical protein [Luteococcus sp.]MDN5562564.1 hypothetical protein [Luteococcus sp.]